MSDLEHVFKRISERFEMPVRIGSQCEAQVFYHLSDLTVADLDAASSYLSDRIIEVCEPSLPSIILHLPSCITDLPDLVAKNLAEKDYASDDKKLETINSDRILAGNGIGQKLKGANVVIVNDVITTAKSCLELHTRLTLMGAVVLAWVTLIDRTFGPGPVPVIAAHTGEPVKLLQKLT